MYFIPIAAFCTAYYIVNVVQLHMAIKKAFRIDPVKRMKPVDCVQCLSVWLSVVLYFLPIGVSEALGIIFLTGFISTKIR